MTDENRVELVELNREHETAARILPPDRHILDELVKALAPHPGGLRRWSVMRTIRKERETAAREVPQKFEDEIERIFRRYCADAVDAKTGPCAAKDAYFYRPKDKAGEVWSIFPERAKAWLAAEPAEGSRSPMSCRGNKAQPYRGA